MSNAILVTPRTLTREGHPSLQRLEAAGYDVRFCTKGQIPDEAELSELLPGCVGYLAGVERISARTLERARDLKVISRNGAGMNNVDLEAAERLGIRVFRTPGANARGVAELAIADMLVLVRHIALADRQIKNGLWDRTKGIELQGRTLGLVGCGCIGREVACMALGLGMQVIGYDPCRVDDFSPAGFSYVELDDIWERSEIISLHCPPASDGTPLVDRDVLARMRPGVYLVNTARGELLDDAAVLDALNSGHLAGLAIDAFREEPPVEHLFVKHERVVATPHIGGNTREGVDRAVGGAVDNLLKALRE